MTRENEAAGRRGREYGQSVAAPEERSADDLVSAGTLIFTEPATLNAPSTAGWSVSIRRVSRVNSPC